MAQKRIRVLIVADDPMASDTLRLALTGAGAAVIGKAVSGREAIELARHYAPDVVFLDRLTADLDGVPVIEALIALDMGIRPILLVGELAPDEGLAAIRGGARGYLSRGDVLGDNVPRLLAAAMAEELVCSRRMMTALVYRLVRSPLLGRGFRPVRSPLTSREWEVLDLLTIGHSTGQVAEELVISTETVRTHVKHLMRKLAASTRAELIAKAGRLRGEDPVD